MTRTPFIDVNGKKKGTWSVEEDDKLRSFIQTYGIGKWHQVPKYAGLDRCEKSCRLRWVNYLSPDVKKGNYTKQEEYIIVTLHQKLGNRWAAIAKELPGRTDNDIKNYWHTHIKKRYTKQKHIQEYGKSYEINWRELKEPSHVVQPSKRSEDSINLLPVVPILDSSQLAIGSSSEIPRSESNGSKLMFCNDRHDQYPPSNDISGSYDLEDFIRSQLSSFDTHEISECNNISSIFNDVGRTG